MINLGIGNYRGELHAKKEGGKYFWAVECDMDNPDHWGWEEIPKYLFDALAKHEKKNSDNGA